MLALGTRNFGRSARVFTGYAFSSVALTGATIVSGLLILRWLEPAEVGVWQTLLVVQAYLTVTRLGIPNAFNREMPFHLGRGETEIARRFAETTLLHAIAAGIFSFVALIVAWPFFAPRGYTWQWAFPAAALMAASMSYRTYLFATMRSTVDFKSVSYVQLANACTTMMAPLVVWQFGFIGLCLHGAAEALAITGLTHSIRPMRVQPHLHRDALRTLVRTGMHLFITSYLFTAALTFDRVVLLYRGDIALVGLYAPALAVASAMAVLPNAVAVYAYPRLSFAHGEGASPEELWRLTSRPMWAGAVLGIPIALVVILALPTIARTFVPNYVQSVTVMQYAAISGVFMGMTTGTAVLRSLKAWRALYFFIITFVVLRWTLPFVLSATIEPLQGVALGSLIASAGAAALTWVVARHAVFSGGAGSVMQAGVMEAPVARGAAAVQSKRASFDLFNFTLGLGLVLLTLPWAIRALGEHVELYFEVRVTAVYLVATFVLMFSALLSLLSGRTPVRALTPGYQIWVAFLAIAFAGLIFIGLLRSNPLVLMAQESLVPVLFLSGLVLGASWQNWRALDRWTLVALGLIGIPGVILSYLSVGVMDVVLLRRGTVYSASVILLPATFYVLGLLRLRSRRLVVIAIAAFVTWTILQLLFLKRAPLLRAGATVGLALIFLPAAWRSKRFMLWTGTTAILIAAASLLFVTESGRNVRKKMLERFQVFDVIEQFIVGAQVVENSQRYDEETFRFRETSIMVENMTWPQRIYGIGAGGYISDPRLAMWDLPVGDRIIPSAKNALHIGFLWSFIKGGLILFIVFQGGLFLLLLNWPRMRDDPLAINCWLFLALNYAFSFLEGFWMQPGNEGLTFMIGAAVGYCVLSASHPLRKAV